MNWIGVEERLPEEALLVKQDILICLSNGNVGYGSFYIVGNKIIRMKFNGTGAHIDSWETKPTHWMPLPSPPKDES